MDDVLFYVFLLVIFAGGWILKVLGKLLSAGSATKTLTEAGKRAKPLIDALSSGDWDKFSDQMKRLGGEEEKQTPPGRPMATGTAVRQQPPETRAQTAPLSLEERLRRYAEERQRSQTGQREEPRTPRPQPMKPPRPASSSSIGPAGSPTPR